VSRRPVFLLLLSALSACSAAFVWFAAFHVPGGRRLDGAGLAAFDGVTTRLLAPTTHGIAVLANPVPFLIGGALLVVTALARRRWLMALMVPLILLSANACTQILKPALSDPRVIDIDGFQRFYPGSWPSGHSTASMSLALCLVLVVGPRLRPLAALVGAGYAIGVGYSLVSGGWHLPSDVFGGYLVAATFTLTGAAALAALEAHESAPQQSPVTISWRALGAPAAAIGSVLGLLAITALMRQPDASLSIRNAQILVVAFAIGALGLALTAGLALVLRRS